MTKIEEIIRFNINAPMIHDDRIADLVKALEIYVDEAVVAELEGLPFTDRETGCMDCLATDVVQDRIATLSKENGEE